MEDEILERFADEDITDITREMRERTNLDGRGMVDNFHIEYGEYGGWDAIELIRAYADRLDAAWKRTEIEWLADIAEARQRHNQATLREAIVRCVNLIIEFGNAEIVKTPLDVIVDIESILNAALASPPLNCNRFATWQEAKAAFWREVGDPADWQRLLEWLYAHKSFAPMSRPDFIIIDDPHNDEVPTDKSIAPTESEAKE